MASIMGRGWVTLKLTLDDQGSLTGMTRKTDGYALFAHNAVQRTVDGPDTLKRWACENDELLTNPLAAVHIQAAGISWHVSVVLIIEDYGDAKRMAKHYGLDSVFSIKWKKVMKLSNDEGGAAPVSVPAAPVSKKYTSRDAMPAVWAQQAKNARKLRMVKVSPANADI